jgi:hypothetical protein
MDAGTLMHVVAIIDAEIKSDREYLASEAGESLTFEETFALRDGIAKLERLSDHFQSAIEAMLDGEEIARGM